MSKLFKKSLAFCVAIAMVFTLFAGTISVNAEDAEETLTVNLVVDNTRVAADAAQAVLPVHVTCSADTSINVLRLIITTTAGKVSNVVSAAETEDYTIYYNGDHALLNAGQTVEDLGGFNAAELLVTVDLNEGLTEEAYAITIDARSENAADANENALKISYETAYILLPHTHTMSETYSYDDNGHWLACTSEFCEVVGGYTTEVADHELVDGEITYTDCTSAGTKAQACSVCEYTTTVEVDAKGHTLSYVNNGENHTVSCSACDYTETVDHSYVDGACACGATEVTECEHAPVADTREFVSMSETEMVFSYECSVCGETYNVTYNIGENSTIKPGLVPSLDLGNDISINFRYKVERFNDYEELTLICNKEVYAKGATESTIKQFVLTNYTQMTSNGTPYYQFVISDIAAFEMGNNVNAILYAKNKATGEMQFIWESDYSVLTYANGMLSKATTDSKLKVAIVDLLNYGAAVQTYANFNVNNLVNANLAAEYAALGTSVYPDANTDFVNDFIVNSRPDGFETLTPAGKVSMINNINVENKVDVLFKVNRYNNSTSYDPSTIDNLYFQFNYYSALGEYKTSEVIHIDVTDDDDSNGYLDENGKITVKFSEGPMSTLSYPVTCTIFYGDPSNGGQWVNRTEYSIETYISNHISDNNPPLVDMLKKMYAYGYSIAAFANVPKYSPAN